ncbi:DUF494 family protein [Legionella feeleii]|uniref:Uncharacterized protein conserved in bacteria n=1 Tax=Legionella feeleii TaxID=453 RepID=A0A0W0U4H7_9GAMM|nr:DUF494 family protein [Legionella feeleii]KTD02947.1 hypothetical protein Lfee_0563 [Legionella feeleii]SPX62409.1 Uncharacterized protein conserved in bacteria [Legionella feeleii]STX39604.1 Uncharacterized protein conserved in bacteria [Legionella feeleii]
MKDSLFEMLMNFFEKSLSQLKESTTSATPNENGQDDSDVYETSSIESRTVVIKAAQDTAMRVFTADEKMRLTKASYQFITRLMSWGIVESETLEIIINQLLFSESRFVTLQETKWTIRNTLAENLDAAQLAFLDLVLYQKEDELPLH